MGTNAPLGRRWTNRGKVNVSNQPTVKSYNCYLFIYKPAIEQPYTFRWSTTYTFGGSIRANSGTNIKAHCPDSGTSGRLWRCAHCADSSGVLQLNDWHTVFGAGVWCVASTALQALQHCSSRAVQLSNMLMSHCQSLLLKPNVLFLSWTELRLQEERLWMMIAWSHWSSSN